MERFLIWFAAAWMSGAITPLWPKARLHTLGMARTAPATCRWIRRSCRSGATCVLACLAPGEPSPRDSVPLIRRALAHAMRSGGRGIHHNMRTSFHLAPHLQQRRIARERRRRQLPQPQLTKVVAHAEEEELRTARGPPYAARTRRPPIGSRRLV